MAEFAFEPEPEVRLAPGESVKEISGRSPWRIAGRRLGRNRLALASLTLFVLIVVVSLLASVYAHDIAHTDPFSSNVSGTTTVNGKTVNVIQQGGGALGIGETPIGATWHSNYFIGADNQGRDVMARVLYGGRSSLQIGVASAVICCLIALLLGLIAGFFRGWTDAILSRLMDRSNSAMQPKMWKVSRPAAEVVSIRSVSDSNPIPRFSRSSTVSISWRKDRARRSNLQQTRISSPSSRMYSSAAFSSGRSR